VWVPTKEGDEVVDVLVLKRDVGVGEQLYISGGELKASAKGFAFSLVGGQLEKEKIPLSRIRSGQVAIV